MILIINIIIILVCFYWLTSIIYSLGIRERIKAEEDYYHHWVTINYPIYVGHLIALFFMSIIPVMNVLVTIGFTLTIIIIGKIEEDSKDSYQSLVITNKTVAGKIMTLLKKILTKQLN